MSWTKQQAYNPLLEFTRAVWVFPTYQQTAYVPRRGITRPNEDGTMGCLNNIVTVLSECERSESGSRYKAWGSASREFGLTTATHSIPDPGGMERWRVATILATLCWHTANCQWAVVLSSKWKGKSFTHTNIFSPCFLPLLAPVDTVLDRCAF